MKEIEDLPGCRNGLNAWPVNHGRCCFRCDCIIVTPRRLREAGIDDERAEAVGAWLLDLHKQKIKTLNEKTKNQTTNT
jgi:hypothetical protein